MSNPSESNDDQNTDDPKIIIDDDWKSQVQKEKEDLGNQADPDSDPESDTFDPESEVLPPPSFAVLLSTLATQAMAAMGFIPNPISGEPEIHRPMAKHFIDTLAMLSEKTKGNLDEEESASLRDALHQLRMAYVASEKMGQPTPSDSNPPNPKGDSPTIELP